LLILCLLDRIASVARAQAGRLSPTSATPRRRTGACGSSRRTAVSSRPTASREYAPEPKPETKKKDVVWFAFNDDRPLFAFAGIWTTLNGDRGTKSKPIPGRIRPMSALRALRRSHEEQRDGDRVRLITRGGYNFADRYPRIVEAALKNRHRQFVIDGEAVVLGVDGISDFDALHSKGCSSTLPFKADITMLGCEVAGSRVGGRHA
jgi:hypothetical protein